MKTFLDVLENELGAPPVLYTARNFWNENLNDTFGAYPLWIAEYDVEAPTLPEGWSAWTLWQWKGDAAVPGVEKSADLSRLAGETSTEDLVISAQSP